ncbi:hypothetical protein M0534_02575 [Methylonatrum kenyense]|uniref:hypothetical protein n=1 Tax=Methylonatrum kenyense TaxID=455253 RepID=UPI0020BE27DA|nr:hypothetical protein [Methylonatrum kenyense]MCK8515219.1 hypothetical protein [Methylonatrum kenyense]
MGLMQQVKNVRWLLFAFAFALILAGCGGGSSGGSSSSGSSSSNGDDGLDDGDGSGPGGTELINVEPVSGPLDPLQALLGETVFDELIAALRENDLDGEAEAVACIEESSNLLVDGGDALLIALIEEDPSVGGLSDAVLADAELANRIAAFYQRLGNGVLLALGSGGTCNDPGNLETGVPEVDAAAMELLGEIDNLVIDLLASADDPTTTPDAIRDVLAMANVEVLLSELETLVESSGLDVPLFDDLSEIAGTVLMAVEELLVLTGGEEALSLVDNIVDLTLDTTEVLLVQLLDLNVEEVDELTGILEQFEVDLLDDVLNDVVGLLSLEDTDDVESVIADLQAEVEGLLEVDGGLLGFLNGLLDTILGVVEGLLGLANSEVLEHEKTRSLVA